MLVIIRIITMITFIIVICITIFCIKGQCGGRSQHSIIYEAVQRTAGDKHCKYQQLYPEVLCYKTVPVP